MQRNKRRFIASEKIIGFFLLFIKTGIIGYLQFSRTDKLFAF